MASDRDQETARAILNATVREQRVTLAAALAKARAEGAKEAQAEIARLRAQLAGREADLVALRTAVWAHAAAMESWRDRCPNARLGRWCISALRDIAAVSQGAALLKEE